MSFKQEKYQNKMCYKHANHVSNANKFAIATIRIDEPECSEIQNFCDVIEFTKYIENNE